jgi:hypothetical protein
MQYAPEEARFLLGPTLIPDVAPSGSIGHGKKTVPLFRDTFGELMMRVHQFPPKSRGVCHQGGTTGPSPPPRVEPELLDDADVETGPLAVVIILTRFMYASYVTSVAGGCISHGWRSMDAELR